MHPLSNSLILVDSEIRNGGISQLYHNSTWAMIPDAIKCCSDLKLNHIKDSLWDMIKYYHKSGRSKLVRKIPELKSMNIQDWNKSLNEIEQQYYDCYPLSENGKWNISAKELLKRSAQQLDASETMT